jgi:glycosyltransferase involved in cell wall biosynthesis
VTKFQKYLPEFGFQTCILTTQLYGTLPTDKQNRVYRAFEPATLYRPLLNHLFQRKKVVPYSHRDQRYEGTRSNKLRNWIRYHLAIPDRGIVWFPAAVLMGLNIIQKENVDIVVSSSPVETTHLVAWVLAKKTGKPWVADFRDGWLYDSLKLEIRHESLRKHVERLLESKVVRNSQAITTVSQPITDYFRSQYPAHADKCHTITNGYDPDDWQNISSLPRHNTRFRIVHAGSFARSRSLRDPRPFFQALALLDKTVLSQTEFILIGALTAEEEKFLSTLPLGETVRVEGQVTKEESLTFQLSADLLLLVVGEEKSVATTKLYEYLYANRPILAVSDEDTAAAQIVRQTGTGFIVDPRDSQAIASSIQSLYSLWQKGELTGHASNINAYHRRSLTQNLVGILNTILENKNY